MVSVYDIFKTNAQDELDGKWLYFGPESDPTTPKMRLSHLGGANDQRLEAIRAEEFAPYVGQEIKADHPASIRVLARAAVREWGNMPSAEDTWEFNLDNVIKILTDLPHMRDRCYAFAGGFGNYKDRPTADQTGTDRKN